MLTQFWNNVDNVILAPKVLETWTGLLCLSTVNEIASGRYGYATVNALTVLGSSLATKMRDDFLEMEAREARRKSTHSPSI